MDENMYETNKPNNKYVFYLVAEVSQEFLRSIWKALLVIGKCESQIEKRILAPKYLFKSD